MGVGAAYPFWQRDVVVFRNQEFGVVASGFEGCDDLPCEFSSVGVFEELAVWGAFAGGVVAVGGV